MNRDDVKQTCQTLCDPGHPAPAEAREVATWCLELLDAVERLEQPQESDPKLLQYQALLNEARVRQLAVIEGQSLVEIAAAVIQLKRFHAAVYGFEPVGPVPPPPPMEVAA